MSLKKLVDDSSENQLLGLARIAEAAERYDDMCKFMKKLVLVKTKKNASLAVEERNLLSVAYKNVVGAKRSSWRTLQGSNDETNETDKEAQEQYKQMVEQELDDVCQEVLTLLTESLLKGMEDKDFKDDQDGSETKVFYLKMCGDYCRYLAEFTAERDPDSKHPQKAETFYRKAYDEAEVNLPETHPTRLGLALNFSVCYYEILKQPEKACELAKTAFDSAIEKLDTLNDSSYKDSTLIMQLLRDNLTLWTSEGDAEQN